MIRKAIRWMSAPAEWLGHHLHRKTTRNRQFMLSFEHRRWFYRLLHTRKLYTCLIGLLVSFAAAHLYHNHPEVPTVANDEFWELTAFGLHGFGFAPIIRVVADFFSIEI